ncbi:hypothetical protein [Aquifex aeolicus]|uniref:Uncharacterized protein aq_aa27 n=1 Tax=Aquifex aeolicus (strain VF5) TaxID=224324 RepID=YZ27_AQUAE|nr:hypothetical protein [Aquifex aeolicus]O66418.1 RecName: Full=Uncharacterized protein aq_aa27 [Aquifex aeolicus VF5]AAC07970.1 putative protein [Aquifex aeolicus VF5]
MIKEFEKNEKVKNVVLNYYYTKVINSPIFNEAQKSLVRKKAVEESAEMFQKLAEKKKEILISPQKIQEILKNKREDKDEKVNVAVCDGEIFYNGKSVVEISIPEESVKKTVIAIKDYIELSTETSEEHRFLTGEAIIFSFYSVFLKEVREKATELMKDINKFPVFSLLIGTPKAGKTTLLNFIAKLLGTEKIYYGKLKETRNSKANTFEAILYIDNRMPVLIDEVPPEHLRDKRALGSKLKAKGIEWRLGSKKRSYVNQ